MEHQKKSSAIAFAVTHIARQAEMVTSRQPCLRSHNHPQGSLRLYSSAAFSALTFYKIFV